MNERTSTWSTWRDAVSVMADPHHLKRTMTIALIVGSTFFAMNQFSIVVAGHANATIWVKVALTYLTPLLVSNFGVLSATRRVAAHNPSPQGA